MHIDDLKDLDDETRKKIEELLKVVSKGDVKESSRAKIDIGIALAQSNDVKGALLAWSNIQREDNSKLYAEAQFNIGVILEQNGYIEEALSAWSNVNGIDNTEVYAHTQLLTGIVLAKSGNIKGALSVWKNINYADNSEVYASAQLNIGIALEQIGEIEEALHVWSKIDSVSSPKIYNQVQPNIGTALYKKGEREKALSIWSKIQRVDDPKAYAHAQFNIGIALEKNGDIEGALSAWRNIKRKDDSQTYAQARFSIGYALSESNDTKGALSAWNSIKRLDNSDIYASAQFNIGMIYKNEENNKLALKAWNNIKQSDNPEIYAKAQSNIGIILINDDLIAAEKAFKIANEYHLYSSDCYLEIIRLLSEKSSNKIGKKLQLLFEEVTLIIKELTLDFGVLSVGEKHPERKLAHYTSTDTANKMLSIDDENALPSSFRLNTINNVNDPSEGQLLISYLNADKGQTSYTPDFNEEFQAFVSCFTFNHDSLNQFRLYGKQDNKEASGVSFVFNKDFFQSSSSPAKLSFLYNQKKLKYFSKNMLQKNIENSQITIETEKSNKKISKQLVMRCVYLETSTGYIELAQRNRLTFYRELEENPKLLWEKYKSDIDIKTEQVNRSLELLRVTYQDIRDNYTKDFTEHSYLIDKIFLPLKYLIKHPAFQEEQECRMVYITSLDNPKVRMDYGKFLYIEYEASVKEHLDKIYIAPVATQYRHYLAKLLCKSEGKSKVRIELSNNPYRQT